MNLLALGSQHRAVVEARARDGLTPPGETPAAPTVPQPVEVPPGPPPISWQGASTGPAGVPRLSADEWVRGLFSSAR